MCKYFADSRILMYNISNILGVVFLLIFNLKHIKDKKLFLGDVSRYFISKKNTLIARTKSETTYALVETIIFSVFQFAFAAQLNFSFGKLLNTGSNYFGLLFFTPILLAVVSIFLSVNIFKQMDLLTPAFPLFLTFAKFGCFFSGCCRGFECEWGLINYQDAPDIVREFPVQLLEAGLALGIFIFLVYYRKKAKEGTMFPIYIIIYSTLRFFSEFTRKEPNILGMLKKYQIICLIGIVIGFIELVAATKYKYQITAFCDKLSKSLNQMIYNYALKKGIIRKKNITHHKKKK